MKATSAITFLLCAMCLAATDKPKSDVLGIWVGGSWPLEGKMLDTEHSKAATLTGSSSCAWSPEHVFVVCDEIVYVNGNPERNLGVYSFDKANDIYHYVELTPQGTRPIVNDLVISDDGKRWEYRGTSSAKGVRYRTVNLHQDADHIEWWSEYSTDEGQHWTRMGGGTETRKK